MILKTIEYPKHRKREQVMSSIEKALDKLDEDNTNLQVFICNDYPIATLRQRGYLFGVVLKIIEEHTGTSVEDLFELFKTEFGDPMHAEEIAVGQFKLTTKTYSTKNMTIFIEKIRNWATEGGLYIPEANAVPDSAYIRYNM